MMVLILMCNIEYCVLSLCCCVKFSKCLKRSNSPLCLGPALELQPMDSSKTKEAIEVTLDAHKRPAAIMVLSVGKLKISVNLSHVNCVKPYRCESH